MSILKVVKKEQIISALVEGNSIRSIERMTGVHRDTIVRLSVRAGSGCKEITSQYLQDLPCENIHVDKILCFVSKKQRQPKPVDDHCCVGKIWTYFALDPNTKLVPSYLVGWVSVTKPILVVLCKACHHS